MSSLISENLISAEVSSDDRKAIMEAIAAIRARLPFLVDLSNEERDLLPKMGEQTHSFVMKLLELAKQHPELFPKEFNLAEFQKDVELYNNLFPLLNSLKQLNQLVSDTLVAVGSDIYTEALEAYTYAQSSGKAQGLDDIRAIMSRRFFQRNRTS